MSTGGVPFGALATAAVLSAATIVPALAPAAPPAPEGPDRPADQTFLTYPEWFLVFSPDERATYLESHRAPSRFPYMGHVAELWESYRAVTDATRIYPFNAGYHVMILVIATSTTAEYGLEAAYETGIGRAFEAIPGGAVPEEALAARGARAYVDFIKVRPWYEFEFTPWVSALWREPLAFSASLPRSLERRYWLTTEYGAKAAYGALIAGATAASYVPAAPTTRVVVDALPADVVSALPRLARVPDARGAVVADVPRYQEFTDYASALARAGVRFRRIAGNDGALALTAITSPGWRPPEGAPYHAIFTQPVLTAPGRARVMLVTDVAHLSETLLGLGALGVEVEHVFDY